MRVFSSLRELPSTCLAIPIANLDLPAADRFDADDSLVIDVMSSEPKEGALFLCRFGSPPRNVRLDVVETKPSTIQGELRWWLRRPGFFMADGPYSHDGENAWYLRSLIVGRVVGYVLSTASLIDEGSAPVIEPDPSQDRLTALPALA